MSRLIYVAGSGRPGEIQRVVDCIKAARILGYTVTHDWTYEVLAAHETRTSDASLTPAQQRQISMDDLRGVERADVLWCVWPSGYSHGMAVEFGFGLGITRMNRVMKEPIVTPLIIVSGPESSRCIFTSLAAHRFDDDKMALHFLGGYRR